MKPVFRSVAFVVVGISLLRCTEEPPKFIQTSQTSALENSQISECAISEITTMDGGELKPKVRTLWLDVKRAVVMRADELPKGEVVRNPYSIKEDKLSTLQKTELADKKLGAEWAFVVRFNQAREPKLILTNGDQTSGLVVTLDETGAEPVLARQGGELATLRCTRVDRANVPPHVELLPAPPPPPTYGCADGTNEQEFGSGMVGCAGSVSFAQRDQLCSAGWTACSAAQWVQRYQGRAPLYQYWTSDDLRWYGNGADDCSVSLTQGSTCNAPMRICMGSSDPLGNTCNWYNCGFETTANQYFGGCENGQLAGTACCR